MPTGFVEALETRGYKVDTTALYTTLANEVLEFFGWHYQLTTTWASGVGAAFDRDLRFGYGMLVSSLCNGNGVSSLEAVGRDQKIVYVLEGPSCQPMDNHKRCARAGAKALLESTGEELG